MGNSQAAAFRNQFETIELRESSKKQLWQHYRCVKSVSRNSLASPTANSPPRATNEQTDAPTNSASGISVVNVKLSVTMLQLNTDHTLFKASMCPPKMLNPDACLPSQYVLKYRMLEACYQAAQWLQRHPHPALLRVDDICFSPEDKAVRLLLPYASLDPVVHRLSSLTSMEVLYGLTKVAEALAHLHSNGVAHRALSWNSVCVATVHAAKGTPPNVLSVLPETGMWLLSNIQFIGGGALKSAEEVSAMKDFLFEIRGLREAPAPSNALAPEWNNPMGAAVDWTKVPCGAGDVYSFGAMLLAVLPDTTTAARQGSAVTLLISPIAGSLLDDDSSVHDMLSHRIVAELRKFAERCMLEDPLQRPHIDSFFDLTCCRLSVFVQTMQSLDHLRKSAPVLRDRLQFFYLLHMELMKVPYEVLIQKMLPRLLQVWVWRDPVAEYFLRHLLVPLPPGSADPRDAFLAAPLSPAHVAELAALQGEKQAALRRAQWLSVLYDGDDTDEDDQDMAYRVAVRRDPSLFRSSDSTPLSKSIPSIVAMTQKSLRDYQLFDLTSAREIALDNEAGTEKRSEAATNGAEEATTTTTADTDTDAVPAVYDVPLLPVRGLVQNADFRALVVPFLARMFNAVVASGGTPDGLQRCGVHTRILCVLLRNMEGYLSGTSLSQVVVPSLIPFLRVCLRHPEVDVVLTAIVALKKLSSRIQVALDKQRSDSRESSGESFPTAEEEQATATAVDKVTTAAAGAEGPNSSSNSILDSLVEAARRLRQIINTEVLSIACTDTVPSLRLSALVMMVKTIVVDHRSAKSSGGEMIVAGRIEAIAALCQCFCISTAISKGKGTSDHKEGGQSVEVGMRRVAYRAVMFAVKHLKRFSPRELTDDIMVAAMSAFYEYQASASAAEKESPPLSVALLGLVNGAADRLKELPTQEGVEAVDWSGVGEARSPSTPFRCGSWFSVQRSVTPRTLTAASRNPPGTHTPIRLSEAEFEYLPFTSFVDFDQEWNSRGGVLPCTALTASLNGVGSSHAYTCSTKAHPYAVLLPSRSDTLLLVPQRTATGSTDLLLTKPSKSTKQHTPPPPQNTSTRDDDTAALSATRGSNNKPARKRTHVGLDQFQVPTEEETASTSTTTAAVGPTTVNEEVHVDPSTAAADEVLMDHSQRSDDAASKQSLAPLQRQGSSAVAPPPATTATSVPRRKKLSFNGGRQLDRTIGDDDL